MFRIKICGVTTAEDAVACVDAGAGAIGLNFHAGSSRFVPIERAAEVIAPIGRQAVKVGVFVNATADFVRHTCDRLSLDAVQLHGDEPPSFIAQLGARPVIRALGVGPGGLGPVLAYLDECRALGALPAMVLLDSAAPGVYGGSGQTADWSVVARYPRDGSLPPLVLAGGLTAENVEAAIRAVRPAAVDVASGVESAPGRKDAAKLSDFVRRARRAMEFVG